MSISYKKPGFAIGEPYFQRGLLFYIESHVPCSTCEAFLKSESLKTLRSLKNLVANVPFTLESLPCDWEAYDVKRYLDRELDDLSRDLEKRLEEGLITEEEYRIQRLTLKGYSWDQRDFNFAISQSYVANFPALVIESYCSGLKHPKVLIIESIIDDSPEGEPYYAFVDYLKDYLEAEGMLPQDLISKFKYEKATLGVNGLRKHQQRQREKKEQEEQSNLRSISVPNSRITIV